MDHVRGYNKLQASTAMMQMHEVKGAILRLTPDNRRVSEIIGAFLLFGTTAKTPQCIYVEKPVRTLDKLSVVDDVYTKIQPYHHYLLWNETMPYEPKDIPQTCIKLDDLAYAVVRERSGMNGKKLNAALPADFDVNGMPRAQRTPTGWAPTRYCN